MFMFVFLALIITCQSQAGKKACPYPMERSRAGQARPRAGGASCPIPSAHFRVAYALLACHKFCSRLLLAYRPPHNPHTHWCLATPPQS